MIEPSVTSATEEAVSEKAATAAAVKNLEENIRLLGGIKLRKMIVVRPKPVTMVVSPDANERTQTRVCTMQYRGGPSKGEDVRPLTL